MTMNDQNKTSGAQNQQAASENQEKPTAQNPENSASPEESDIKLAGPMRSRTGPNALVHDGVYGFNLFHGGRGYASFPSGHTAVTCAMITVLWIYYPKWRPLYAMAVFGVGIGLIGANYHFLGDVLAGGFVGISSGWMLTSLWKAHEHFGERNQKR